MFNERSAGKHPVCELYPYVPAILLHREMISDKMSFCTATMQYSKVKTYVQILSAIMLTLIKFYLDLNLCSGQVNMQICGFHCMPGYSISVFYH